MFNHITTIQQGVARIKAANDDESFNASVCAVVDYLRSHQYDSMIWHKLEEQAYYQKNEYSDNANIQNITEAKDRVVRYIEDSVIKHCDGSNDFSDSDRLKIICKMLDNFREFLTALWERTPHKYAETREEVYQSVRIQNEYDLQFLMYAYLKPLFPEIRDEISEDSGYSSIRLDFKIDEKIVIETKCSRKGMSERKLTEEIATDITLYPNDNVFFYIYDKERIIKNVYAFKSCFNSANSSKKIFIFVEQPIVLR